MNSEKTATSEDKGTPAVSAPAPKPRESILVIDIGGSSVKILVSGHSEPRSFPSGKKLTPGSMIEQIKSIAFEWNFDAVSIGYPGLVGPHGPRSEPGNLGTGWVGFDYATGFGCPVKIANDAAMQALGSYDGGRMLFIGLGTGVGSTLISDNVIIPLELGDLWWSPKKKLSDILGKQGLKSLGLEKWRIRVEQSLHHLRSAFNVDYVVLGGGNASKLAALPAGTRLGHNLTAFRGGLRLWNLDDIPTLDSPHNHAHPEQPRKSEWRLV